MVQRLVTEETIEARERAQRRAQLQANRRKPTAKAERLPARFHEVLHGDCLTALKSLDTGLAHAIVTDPPAGISFMGKSWDDDKGGRDEWIAWLTAVMVEAKRVLKPGGHALVWALPRTSHWTATALENAGFEIRDVITHLFSSGFPKSANISKALSKKTEVDAARQWEGFGTALKPASEHWILVRSPLAMKTVAENVKRVGVGALNIDECKIGDEERHNPSASNVDREKWRMNTSEDEGRATVGRWPANLVLSHSEDCGETCVPGCAVGALDEQSGFGTSPSTTTFGPCYGDSGGASRFFYCAKPSRSEKNAGCDDLDSKLTATMNGGIGAREHNADEPTAYNQNHHPTVKSIALMSYLVKLVTPPGGIVLDPFAGSGTTLVAAKRIGRSAVGIEKEYEYWKICKARLEKGAYT